LATKKLKKSKKSYKIISHTIKENKLQDNYNIFSHIRRIYTGENKDNLIPQLRPTVRNMLFLNRDRNQALFDGFPT
jgi:hypothetical protein